MSNRVNFKTTLMTGGEARAWPIITVPFNVEKTFGTRSRVAVKGTINGFPFRSSLFPDGNGLHFLMVNRSIREGAQVKVGDLLSVVLEPDTAPRIVEVPPDFKKTLSRNKKAFEVFEKLPPSHKKAYIDAIIEAKRSETRTRRIEQAVEMLMKGKK